MRQDIESEIGRGDRAPVHLRDCLGRRVISADDGDHIGRVAEVLLDIDALRLVGFRLRHGGLLDRRWRIAAIEDVLAIDPGGIHMAGVIALHEDDHWGNWIRLGRQGVSVFDRSGMKIGTVRDATADPVTHRISVLLVLPQHKWRTHPQQPAPWPLAAFATAAHNSLVVKPGSGALLHQ